MAAMRQSGADLVVAFLDKMKGKKGMLRNLMAKRDLTKFSIAD